MKSIPDYWHSLRDIKDGLVISNFRIFSDFVTRVTVLPHSSSASVEEILVSHIKTKTNSLKQTLLRKAC